MANPDAAYGLRPYRHPSGEIRQVAKSIASGYGTTIYTGDVVELTGAGDNIAKAAAGNVDNIGVFAGCKFTDSEGKVQFKAHWPASTVATNIEAYVYEDPMIEFIAQTDSCAEAAVGALADLVGTGGSTLTGMSTMEVEGSSVATTGKTFRIKSLAPLPDNEYGTNAQVVVQFAEHVLLTGAAGAGGV